MTTALLTHPDCLKHATPPGHPRLEYINDALAAPEFATLQRVEAPLGDDAQIGLAHPQDYINRIRDASPASGVVSLDGDTHMAPGSLNAALRAVGGNVKAVDMVMQGEVGNAFVACRPPQDLVWNDERIFFASSHQMPLYPGSGHAHEVGAHGQVLNLPLDPMTGGKVMRQKYENIVFPAVDAFKPELILISAGFDAHAADPLANLNFVEDDFAWLTQKICDLADTHAEGRVVSTLEGGYDLDALAASTAAHVSTLMERSA